MTAGLRVVFFLKIAPRAIATFIFTDRCTHSYYAIESKEEVKKER